MLLGRHAWSDMEPEWQYRHDIHQYISQYGHDTYQYRHDTHDTVNA